MAAKETPVIIGVGDIKNRSTEIADAKEPATLIHTAILNAISDASPTSASQLQQKIDSIDVVRTWTWPYPDLPGQLGGLLGVEKGLKHKFYSDHGGNQPGCLLDDAAKRVARGEVGVAVVCGGEALASLSACAKAKKMPPPGWTTPSEPVDSVFVAGGHFSEETVGAIHKIGDPIHVYPLYENGFRAHRGQSIKENHDESSKLYAEFSKVAEHQEFAWNYGRYDDEKVIGTVTKKNRMICFPYPLLMNAFNTINLAGAVILTSTTTAKALGVPSSKWIYPLSGAGTKDCDDFWDRPNFYSSPSISNSIDASISLSGLRREEIELFDFYSCFPVVPKIAAHHLGIPITGSKNGITLLGGLTSFGGAGNNYSMHAITAMTRALRDGSRGKNGLVLCNGGLLSYQHVVVLSKEQSRKGPGYPLGDPLPKEITDVPAPQIEKEAEGEAVVETYTVEFARTGEPLRGHIVGRLKSNNKRFLANHGDDATLREMASGAKEVIGRSGYVSRDPQKKSRGLFSFEENRARL